MERITEYLETNFKLAYKSVTFHFKRFIWFYIAIFIVQSLLGIVSLSSDINKRNIESEITDKYDAHYVFYYMNTNQRIYLQNASNYFFKSDYFFDVTRIKEYGDETKNDYKCDVYITFADDPIEGYERFQHKYSAGLEALGSVYSAPTPLFELEGNLQKDESLYNFYIIVISAFSLILLTILYNIRSNNYRFDYGIYMAFGADKKKLLNTSFWEMTVIAILTFIPSILFSAILNYIAAKISGLYFAFNLLSCIKVLSYTLGVNALSVLFVIVKTALKTPISLIVSQDNSNMVHSPKVSVDIFKKKKLSKLNNLSMLRYAKYYSVLVLSGVLFSALFVCGVYCSEMYNEKQSSPVPQFEVTFQGTSPYTEEDRRSFLEFDGIIGTYKEASTHVMGLDEHILVRKSNARITANRVVYDDEYLAMHNVVYYAADDEVLEYLKTAKHTGDLSSILNDDKTIIITESFENTTHFDFKPGDKIKLADCYTKMSQPDMFLTGEALLKERLRCFFFLYEEYTVGAVIHDDCADENLKIFMNSSLYEKTTGKKAEYRQVSLFADEKLTHREYERLYANILKINNLQYREKDGTVGVFVKNLYTNVDRALEKSAMFDTKLLIASLLILLVSSIIWFFSQTLFYGKRSNEYTVLRSVGLTLKEIRSMFVKDALSVSVFSLAAYSLLSYILCFGLHKFMNSWLFYYTFRYSFDVPVPAFAVGAAITVLFSFLSTLVTYLVYKKKTKNTIPDV